MIVAVGSRKVHLFDSYRREHIPLSDLRPGDDDKPARLRISKTGVLILAWDDRP